MIENALVFFRNAWRLHKAGVITVIVVPIVLGLFVNYFTEVIHVSDLMDALKDATSWLLKMGQPLIRWLDRHQATVAYGLLALVLALFIGKRIRRTLYQSTLQTQAYRELSCYIGREAELSLLRSVIANGQTFPSIIAIWGFPGVGKTALLEIAYWLGREHNYNLQTPPKGLYQVLNKNETFAGFLSRCSTTGIPEGFSEWSVTEKMRFLADGLPERCLLIIDEFQYMDDGFKSDFLWFARYLSSTKRHVVVVTAGREMPDFLADFPTVFVWRDRPLAEFDRRELGEFLKLRFPDFVLDRLSVERLYQITRGNAKLVEYVCSDHSLWESIGSGRIVGLTLLETLWQSLQSDADILNAMVTCCVISSLLPEWPSHIGFALVEGWSNHLPILIRKCLLTRSANGTYKVSDVLREYVLDKLEHSSLMEIYNELGFYLDKFVNQSNVDLPVSERATLVISAIDCFSLSRNTGTLVNFTYRHYHFLEDEGFLAELNVHLPGLSESDFSSISDWARWLSLRALVALAASVYSDAEAMLRHANDIYLHINERDKWIETSLELARIYRLVARYEDALNVYHDLLVANQGSLLSPLQEAEVLRGQGRSYIGLGHHLMALQALNAAEAVSITHQSANMIVDVLRSKTVILRDLGLFDEALGAAHLAVEWSKNSHVTPRSRFYSARSMSSCLKMQGDLRQAFQWNGTAEQINSQLRNTRFTANVAWGYADCYRYQQAYKIAEPIYEEALQLYQLIDDKDGCLYTAMAQGFMYAAFQDFDNAETNLRLAHSLAIILNSELEQHHCSLGLEIVDVCLGNHEHVQIELYLDYYQGHEIRWAEAFMFLVAAAQETDAASCRTRTQVLWQTRFCEYSHERQLAAQMESWTDPSVSERVKRLMRALVVRLF